MTDPYLAGVDSGVLDITALLLWVSIASQGPPVLDGIKTITVWDSVVGLELD